MVRLNGTQLAALTGNLAWHPTTFYLFSYWFNQSYQFLGDIGEMLVYDHVITPTERADVYNYLQDKWGMPNGL